MSKLVIQLFDSLRALTLRGVKLPKLLFYNPKPLKIYNNRIALCKKLYQPATRIWYFYKLLFLVCKLKFTYLTLIKKITYFINSLSLSLSFLVGLNRWQISWLLSWDWWLVLMVVISVITGLRLVVVISVVVGLRLVVDCFFGGSFWWLLCVVQWWWV